MQPDPIGPKAVNLRRPESLNRYSYTQNDPVNFVDSTGLLRAYWECTTVGWIWYDGWWSVSQCTLSYEDSGGGRTRGEPEPGGGGGGGQAVDKRSKEQKRKDALAKAFGALYDRPECNDLISGHSGVASALLSVLSDRGRFTEQEDEFFHKSENRATPAITRGQGENATIKLRPTIEDTGYQANSFFDSPRHGLRGVPGELDVDIQRAIIFLHELSHATGRYTHPGQGDPKDFDEPPISQEEINKRIYETCFK